MNIEEFHRMRMENLRLIHEQDRQERRRNRRIDLFIIAVMAFHFYMVGRQNGTWAAMLAAWPN